MTVNASLTAISRIIRPQLVEGIRQSVVIALKFPPSTSCPATSRSVSSRTSTLSSNSFTVRFRERYTIAKVTPPLTRTYTMSSSIPWATQEELGCNQIATIFWSFVNRLGPSLLQYCSQRRRTSNPSFINCKSSSFAVLLSFVLLYRTLIFMSYPS